MPLDRKDETGTSRIPKRRNWLKMPVIGMESEFNVWLDEVEIDPGTGVIRDLTKGTQFQAKAFPEFLQEIISRGGLRAYAEEVLAKA